MKVHRHNMVLNGIKRLLGEVISEPLRKASKLLELKYLLPHSGDVVTCEFCGRQFVNSQILEYHKSQDHIGEVFTPVQKDIDLGIDTEAEPTNTKKGVTRK